ncbi:MAG TPA: hypothetical protein VKY65_04920 [Alphaproteobacteria bacterium]|nr:hypothetical protein [Alphaproteobacteria bacterium]
MCRRHWAAWILVLVFLVGLAGVSFAKRTSPGPSMDDVLRHSRMVPYDRDGAWAPNDL